MAADEAHERYDTAMAAPSVSPVIPCYDEEEQLTATRPYAIRFARNHGQTAAISAGFDAARHDVVIPLDADLQTAPAR